MSDIKSILAETRKIAVVGLSPKPERASYRVALYLRENGFEVIGVRPGTTDIAGIPVVESLKDLEGAGIDCVDVFRASEHVAPIAQEAIDIGAKSLWLQEGVQNERAETLAREAGLKVASDVCIKKEHAKDQNR